MHTIDWIIVAGVFAGLGYIAFKTKKYVKGISGFLAADRCAGRYLLTLADGMASVGAIGFIALFQQNYEAGFGGNWWGGLMGVALMFVSISGFIVYRFRETRAMTMAQFFEMRYSRKFRIFAGILSYTAGIINYGIFPAVTARFIIYFCDIPLKIVELGPLDVNITLGIVMFILLATALLITFRGGQIAIMVTDFLQAQYVNIVFLLILCFLFFQFGWGDSIDVLRKSAPEGKSMINPFAQEDVQDFNMWFFFLSVFNVIYSWMAWQGNQGYNCSARNPHEAKMAKVLSIWRYGVTWVVVSLIPIGAYVVMHSPEYHHEAANVNQALAELQEPGVENQLLVPFAIKEVLPIGFFGLFVGAILAAAISTDDTYLHSWGSILVQDIIVPIRGKPLKKDKHIKYLRRSIVGVAVFVWFWSMLFPLKDYIFMYWAITGSIYVGGAGSAIIGGFYWKRGTTAGAWAAMITGSILSFTGMMLINVIWPHTLPWLKTLYPEVRWLSDMPEAFWLNGMEMFCYAAFISIGMYIFVSLITKTKPGFSMDKLLHRGKYRVKGEHERVEAAPGKNLVRVFLRRLVGIDSEYTRFDKFLAWSVCLWSIFWGVVFVIGCIFGYAGKTTDEGWIKYWIFNTGAYSILGIVTVFWFLWCGIKDLREMFILLKTVEVDDSDDGTVEGF
jgi:solute:Na+ symporter, SSS family